jgi:malate permease and related proteins
MSEVMLAAFTPTFLAMLKIFFIALIAGFLVRRRVIGQDHIQGLTVITIDAFLPCLIFSNIIVHFRPQEFSIWWVLPLSAIVMNGMGIGLGALLFRNELPAKQNMLPLAGIQNSGYLVLPMGAVLFPKQFDLFSLYVFLFILGQNPLIWSVGKYMTTAAPDTRLHWQGLITPPLMATLTALVFILTGLRGILPYPSQGDSSGLIVTFYTIFMDAIVLLGKATVPSATFILGGILGGISFTLKPYIADTLRVIFIKLAAVPVITLSIVYATGLGNSHPLLSEFFIIQSAAAPAISIMLQIKKYGGDEQKVGSILLASYAVCLITLPFWTAVWQSLQ